MSYDDCFDYRPSVAEEMATADRDEAGITPEGIINARVAHWLVRLMELANRPERHPDLPAYTFYIDPLRKYVRVVMSYGGVDQSVHAFFDPITGDVYKAAGWKAPAKGVRFNLLDETSFNRMMDVCDWSGGYLYIR